jgi:hypothetical protein
MFILNIVCLIMEFTSSRAVSAVSAFDDGGARMKDLSGNSSPIDLMVDSGLRQMTEGDLN